MTPACGGRKRPPYAIIRCIQNFSIHIRRAIRKSYYREVMRMDSADWFEVFRETGEPMAYLLCAAAERLETEEREILPSA